VLFNLGLALLLAVLLNQRLAGITLLRTLFFSPVVVSLVAWTIVWGFLLQHNGGINGMLALVGIDGPNWLRSPGTAMVSVIVVQVFKNVGLNMVLFLAALQGVPRELYEAARIDGAPAWRQFRRITLPLISPTLLLTSIITIVGSLQVFAQIAVLTQGGPGVSTTVLVYYLYQQTFQFHRFGYGSTLAVLLFAIVALLTLAQWQLRRKFVFHEQ
jgi:multiple sugar transport system permease protein